MNNFADQNHKMSIWTDSESRIDVPFQKTDRYVCVEHPGSILNVDKALKTIGGTEQLSQTYTFPTQRLALHWRPEDKYSKPAYGDRIATTNLLMKVKKRRRKSDGKEEYKVEILGRVETTYKFQSICDFQYLPMSRKDDGTYENINNKVVLKDLSVDRQKYFSENTQYFIPPTIFSRVDKPCDFLYRQDIEHREGYRNPDVDRPPNLIGTVRERRSIYTVFVNFGEKIPEKPLPQAVKKLSSEYVDPKGAEMIKKLLEEKPLWLKVELEHRTGISSDKFKYYLPALCFYWLNGPWRAQWNKYGHDPTKCPSSKIYQTLDFRIRFVASKMVLDVKAKSRNRSLKRNQQAKQAKHNVKISIKALGGDGNEKKDANDDRELCYKFRPGRNPPQRMTYYPLNYIEVDEVQRLIHQNDGKETRCTDKDGWCVEGFYVQCRNIMYKYVNKCDESVLNKMKKMRHGLKEAKYLKMLRGASGSLNQATESSPMETDPESQDFPEESTDKTDGAKLFDDNDDQNDEDDDDDDDVDDFGDVDDIVTNELTYEDENNEDDESDVGDNVSDELNDRKDGDDDDDNLDEENNEVMEEAVG